MQVGVGDALADDVVEGEERPVTPQRTALCRRHPSGRLPHARSRLSGELGDGWMVTAGDNQSVAVEQRPDVQEGDDISVLEHHVCGGISGDYGVEDAVGLAHAGKRRATMQSRE